MPGRLNCHQTGSGLIKAGELSRSQALGRLPAPKIKSNPPGYGRPEPDGRVFTYKKLIMATTEIILSLVIVFVAFPALFWGIRDRHRRHKEQNIPSPMPDGDYYFGVNIEEVDKKMIHDQILGSIRRVVAYRELLKSAENYCQQQNANNLIELYQAKEKVKSLNQ